MLLFFAHPFCLSLSPLPIFVLSLYILPNSHLSKDTPRKKTKKKKKKPSYELKEELAVSSIEIEMPQAPSTRWCPTPEQLMILEELYRSGVRTPDASQIQHITAHLSCYGRIEGKNVFYWFQNHKARERQKLRRRLSMHHQFLCSGYPLPILAPHRPMQSFQQDAPLLHVPSHILHQEATQQGLNLLCKLESKGEEFTAPPDGDQADGCDQWMARMEVQPTSCCSDKPLKTLDLFPTRSTGLKDEGNTSKSSWPASPS